MKVFFDTNVLVSAFATHGLCADLFRVVLGGHQLLVGEVVLVELRRALLDRIKLPRATTGEIERMLRKHTVIPKPRHHLDVGLVDKDDEWIIASAVAGGAEVVVTGDRELLEARGRASLTICGPRELWELLRTTAPTR